MVSFVSSGYEVIGIENLPEGPGIIIYYHGALVVDYAFLVARIHIQKGRTINSVVHHFLTRIPGDIYLNVPLGLEQEGAFDIHKGESFNHHYCWASTTHKHPSNVVAVATHLPYCHFGSNGGDNCCVFPSNFLAAD